MRRDPDAMIGMFPADHVIGDEEAISVMYCGRQLRLPAAGENIVVMGIQPTRAETGYGYIEAGERLGRRSVPGEALHGKA